MKQYAFLLFVAGLFWGCCKDEDPNKPKQLFDNKMYATIDGLEWETRGPIGIQNMGAYYYPNDYFLLEGIDWKFLDNSDNTVVIDLKMFNCDDTGTYQFGGLSSNVATLSGPDHVNGSLKVLYCDSLRSGTVHIIKFDTATNHVSGTFEFSVFDSTTNSVKHITNGIINNVYYID
jgi:hypothetical protein